MKSKRAVFQAQEHGQHRIWTYRRSRLGWRPTGEMSDTPFPDVPNNPDGWVYQELTESGWSTTSDSQIHPMTEAPRLPAS